MVQAIRPYCWTDVLRRGLLAVCLAVAAAPVTAELPGDILLFPELTQFGRFELRDGSQIPEQRINPGLNLFYTLDHQRLRFLLEWLVDRNAQEVQRLQLGWRWRDTTFWLGRAHNPIGFWNAHFHHGAYMMTSITRPGVMNYETFGGVLPLHLTGLYVEGTQELGDASLYYVLNAGLGPELRKHRLDALDLLSPEGSRGPAVTLRMGYQPTSFASDEVGFSVSYTEIPAQAAGLGRIEQVVANVYANWRWGDFGLLGEGFFIHNGYSGGLASSQVGNLYAQAEWRAAADLTFYSRVEGSVGVAGDPYFDRFDSFVRDRVMGGIRYDLPYKMAVKLEVSRDHVRDDAFGQAAVQWSAVLP